MIYCIEIFVESAIIKPDFRRFSQNIVLIYQ